MNKLPARGFTLIELMVAIAISMLLVAGGLAAYRGTGDREKVKQAGLGFQTNLKAFQQKALSGEKPTGCLGSLDGFRVEADAGLTSYTVKAECAVVDGPITSFELDDEVGFLAEFTDIVFYTLRSELDGDQTITLAAGDYSYQITIEAGGVIQGQML